MTISTQLTATTDTEANRRMSGEDMRHVFMTSLQSDDTEPSRKKVPPTATKLHRRRRAATLTAETKYQLG